MSKTIDDLRTVLFDTLAAAKDGSLDIERIRAISKDMRPDVHSSLRDEVVDFLDQFKDKIHDLNLRTFLKVINVRIMEPTCWREVAEYVVTA
jgi:hypothetical protein